MKVTKVTINEMKSAGNLKAFATLEFDGQLVVSGFRIIEGEQGIFVSMPQRKHENSYYDIVYPNSKKGREILIGIILDNYNEHVGKDEEPFT